MVLLFTLEALHDPGTTPLKALRSLPAPVKAFHTLPLNSLAVLLPSIYSAAAAAGLGPCVWKTLLEEARMVPTPSLLAGLEALLWGHMGQPEPGQERQCLLLLKTVPHCLVSCLSVSALATTCAWP